MSRAAVHAKTPNVLLHQQGVHAEDHSDRNVVHFLGEEARDQGQEAGYHGHGEGDARRQTPGDRGMRDVLKKR